MKEAFPIMVVEAFLSAGRHFTTKSRRAVLNGRKKKALDFWMWAYSDLMQNITRGYVAQYIVAWAIGVDEKPNDPWQSFDLRSREGRRIEVKSTSFLQSWTHGEGNRNPLFLLAPRLPYSSERGLGKKPGWNADIYVLCYFYCKDPAKADIMNLDQWKFWVIPKTELVNTLNGRKSLTTKLLEANHVPLTAFELKRAISEIHSKP
jgi:hypothetical protein